MSKSVHVEYTCDTCGQKAPGVRYDTIHTSTPGAHQEPVFHPPAGWQEVHGWPFERPAVFPFPQPRPVHHLCASCATSVAQNIEQLTRNTKKDPAR